MTLALLGKESHEEDHVDEGDDDDDEHDPDPAAARLVHVRLQTLTLHLQRAVVCVSQPRTLLQFLQHKSNTVVPAVMLSANYEFDATHCNTTATGAANPI